MFANSRAVTSNQDAPHPALADTVRRHLGHAWRAPWPTTTVTRSPAPSTGSPARPAR